jgi:large subunit ribosomal protein L25
MGSQSIEVDAREFGAMVRARQTTHLIDLGIDGGDGGSVAIVKEIQRDVLKPGHLLHVDFQHVDMNKKVTVQVPIEIVGVPVGVKEEGGILEHHVRHLTVECMPLKMPEHIRVDVSGLKMGEAIHISDLSVTAELEIKGSPEEVLASVQHPAKEPEPEEMVAAEGEAAEGAGGEAEGAGEEKE